MNLWEIFNLYLAADKNGLNKEAKKVKKLFNIMLNNAVQSIKPVKKVVINEQTEAEKE
jgi:hypothetical protein